MSTSISADNPEGQLIGLSSKPWRIGKIIGQGACGTVHEIAKISTSSSKQTKTSVPEFVVKVAPLPQITKTKGKKRKKTPAERNADLLNYENTLYKNVFNNLRGRLIPDVPVHGSSVPPAFGEIDGFRYLVMERMSAPLFQIVTSLQSTYKHDKKSVNLGEVAIAMMECIKEIHENRYVFVDVKPENFMLASCKGSSKYESAAELAKRIRIIDFGLVESFHDISISGHRDDNFPNSQFVGTPLYASLNVLKGHTPSRRDDLEAMLYIVSEMILMLIEGRTNDALPWSNCKSDDEILNIKEKEIDCDNGLSTFFDRMRAEGNENVGDTMETAFDFVRNIKYDEKPKYSQLQTLLNNLVVHPTGSTPNGSKNTARNKSRKVSTKSNKEKPLASIKNKGNVTEFKSVAPKKNKEVLVGKRVTRRSKRIAETIQSEPSPSKSDVVDLVDSDDNEENDDTGVENISPKTNNIKRAKTKKEATAASVMMTFIDGPHAGESFILKEKMLVGRNPKLTFKTSRRKEEPLHYAIEKDTEASAAHVSLVLHSTNRGTMNSVRVTDLDSTNGTYVNGKQIPQGGYKQVFAGEKLKIGTSTIQIKKAN